ncbi:hypothetical protein DWG14_06082 [Streptomyces griseorubiginosus]|uniref:Uncharacterized protein n=2 Tax=Streptomyces griseorubiginosus TaxID=67304 RepID=A0AAI8L5C4_9ACTN|nr:hypothetical protein DWG14_06082 [Streptomyces griseorubiginosus]
MIPRVSRSRLIEKALKYVADRPKSGEPNLVGLVGAGGVGKTDIAEEMVSRFQQSAVSSVLVRLDLTVNRSPLGLLSTIALALDKEGFQKFITAAKEYQGKDDLRRQREFESVVDVFIENLRDHAGDNLVAIGIDNLDIVGEYFRSWLEETLFAAGPNISLFITTRNPANINAGRILSVGSFQRADIDLLVQEMLYEPRQELVDKLVALTGGNALLLVTALEAIDFLGPEQFLSAETFEQLFARRFNALTHSEQEVLSGLAMARFRFTVDVMTAIFDDDHLRLTSFHSISRLPFVRKFDSRLGIRLHDVFVPMVGKLSLFTDDQQRLLADRLVENFYDVALVQSSDRAERRLLASERIGYTLKAGIADAVRELANHVHNAISRFDFDEVESLLSAVDVNYLSASDSIAVALLRVRSLIARFATQSAVRILEDVGEGIGRIRDERLHAEWLYLRAKCVANPVPVPHGDIFEAILLLQESAEICERFGYQNLVNEILFDLARALRSVGRNREALELYNRLRDTATSQDYDEVAVRCVEEISQTYRLMQDLDHARSALEDSYRLRRERDYTGGRGISDYYAANTYRDSGDFPSARARYESAAAFLRETNDENNHCALLADWAWLEFLAGDSDAARRLQESSFQIASRFRFGAELAEHWHTMYHLERDMDRWDEAYRLLERGLTEAKRSNNMYMILDCLMHTAQRALAEHNDGVIEECLSEMEAYERRGCGIHVFRGRTLMFLGDSKYETESFGEAYSAWRDGLVIVAKFGNSRTNVELFDDILHTRRRAILRTVVDLGYVETLRTQWEREGLSARFPAILDMCNEALEISRSDR